MTPRRCLVLAALVAVCACGRTEVGTQGPAALAGYAGYAGYGGFSATGATGATGGWGGLGGTSASGGLGGTGGWSGTGGLGGTGGGQACEVHQDCEDLDPCTTDFCNEGTCVYFPRDDDVDGHVSEACGGDDCNDRNPQVHAGAPEICDDGADNDCNGVADCRDPACAYDPGCGCVPDPAGENCTNGFDDDCDTFVDCLDPDCQGTPACGCLASEVGRCDNGLDDDCDDRIDCDDADCASDVNCICQATPEDCLNGLDDDCDLLVDCADPDCARTSACACIPPGSPEVCDDGRDNDCDELADCADPDCVMSPHCQSCTQEICDDGLDNDCDGYVDCADIACFLHPACPVAPEVCNNGVDDDFDQRVDCDDPDCSANPYCATQQGNCLTARFIAGTGTYFADTTGDVSNYHGTCGGAAGEAVFTFVLNAPAYVHVDSYGSDFDSMVYVRAGHCESGREIGCDDDSAGDWDGSLDFDMLDPGTYYVFLDGYTVDPNLGPDEGSAVLNVVIEYDPSERCADGADNDGDHYTDCADPDCASAPHCLACNGGAPPTPEFGPSACTDGRDNDCDGQVDCDDEDCSASDYYETECCTGYDQNGNGIADDFNCRCASDADCISGQICYTHTAWTCGLPCTRFVGDVCPFVAPGSRCSGTTSQCEFF